MGRYLCNRARRQLRGLGCRTRAKTVVTTSRHRTGVRSWGVAAANARRHGSTPRRAPRTVVATPGPPCAERHVRVPGRSPARAGLGVAGEGHVESAPEVSMEVALIEEPVWLNDVRDVSAVPVRGLRSG